MRNTKQISLQTTKGEAVFTITELSGPALLRLSGPLARAIRKLKPAFTQARTNGADIVEAVLQGLSNLDDKDFQLIQESLFKGHVTARFADGSEDPRAGDHLDELFPAHLVGEFFKLLYESFSLSYTQLFQVVRQMFPTLTDLNSAPKSADAVTSALQSKTL